MPEDKNYFDIAEAVSKASHCLSWKAGCIIVKDKQIVSTGYNGPPSGYPHCGANSITNVDPSLMYTCPRHRMGYRSGEGLEYCPASHAEANAIVQAARHGIQIEGGILYCFFNLVPCRECAKLIVNSGIKEVVLLNPISDYPQAGISGREILTNCGIKIRGVEIEKLDSNKLEKEVKVEKTEYKIVQDYQLNELERAQAKAMVEKFLELNPHINKTHVELMAMFQSKLMAYGALQGHHLNKDVEDLYFNREANFYVGDKAVITSFSDKYHNMTCTHIYPAIYVLMRLRSRGGFFMGGWCTKEDLEKFGEDQTSKYNTENYKLIGQEHLHPMWKFEEVMNGKSSG